MYKPPTGPIRATALTSPLASGLHAQPRRFGCNPFRETAHVIMTAQRIERVVFIRQLFLGQHRVDMAMARDAEIDRLLPLFARKGAPNALLPMPHARHQMMTRRANVVATTKGTGVARGAKTVCAGLVIGTGLMIYVTFHRVDSNGLDRWLGGR